MTLHYLDPARLPEGLTEVMSMRLAEPDGPKDQFVRVPIVVFRRLMAELGGAEFKVLCFLIDRIYSHSRHEETHSDYISYGQIQHGIRARDGRLICRGTHISRSTLGIALRELEAAGVLERTRRTRKDGGLGVTELKLVLPAEVDEGRERAAP